MDDDRSKLAALEAYKQAVVATPSGARDHVRRETLGTLQLENYRKPFERTLDALTPAERMQISWLLGTKLPIEEMFKGQAKGDNAFEMRQLECIDIVDSESGAVVCDLFLYPYGHGVVLRHGEQTVVTWISQHSVDDPLPEGPGKAWLEDFYKAWDEGATRLGFDGGHIHFSLEDCGEPDDE